MSSRFFSSLLIVLSLAFVTAVPVWAQSDGAAEVAAAAGLGGGDIVSIIGTLISVFLGILGIIFLLLVIYSGFLWMTAGGDDKQVDRAKRMLINATVGLIITLMSYAIAAFIINALVDATGTGRGPGENGNVSVETNSGALGGGPIQDHYPLRNQTDVARNTNVVVTFREPINPETLILGYDTNDTFADVTDDTVTTLIDSDAVKIYRTADGDDTALENVQVRFSEDLRSFVFNPDEYLGSPTENTSYTVVLTPRILDIDGDRVFVGSTASGYVWSFETGVNIDTEPPTVRMVTPVAGGVYAKNIVVQMTFDEPIDPTSSTGIRAATSGFQNIQVIGEAKTPTPGVYQLSNGYQTVTFTPSTTCGTNSCGETVYCLPGNQSVTTNIVAATPGASPPQVETFPYDGIVDMAANALDGDGNGTAGDDYSWGFSTTDEINLRGTAIENITPNILEEDVALDQDISITFSDVLMSSTVNSDNISLNNTEISSGDTHEQWYRFTLDFLNAAGDVVTGINDIPAKTLVTVPHGVFLESIDGATYVYGMNVDEGVQNEYQNCYMPAEGPTATGGRCGVNANAPYCCNGVASSTACTLF